MVRPRLRLGKWLVITSITMILILVCYDISIRLSDDGQSNPIGGILILSCFSVVVCGPFVPIMVIVFLASRGDLPPQGDSNRGTDRLQFHIGTIMVVIVVVALTMALMIWLVRAES